MNLAFHKYGLYTLNDTPKFLLHVRAVHCRYAGMQLVAADELGRRAGVLPASFQSTLPPLAMGADIAAGREPVLDLRLSCRVLGFPPANPQF